MRRKQIVLLGMALLGIISVIAIANVSRWMIEGVEELRRNELELVGDRAASGVEAHLSRVSRGLEVVVDLNGNTETGDLSKVARGFAALRKIFPEVGEMLWLQNAGKLYRVEPDGGLMPVGLSVEDLRSDDLEPFVGIAEGGHIRVGVIEVSRQPSTDGSPLEPKQMILFGHSLKGRGNAGGVMLVPYGIGSLVDEYLSVVSEGAVFDIALLDSKGQLVYSSWQHAVEGVKLPFYPGRQSEETMGSLVDSMVLGNKEPIKSALLEGVPVYCEFELQGPMETDSYKMDARLAPITIGGARWTLMVAREHGQLSPTENALRLSTLLGAASLLMGLIVASAFFLVRYHRQARRHLQFESAIALSASAILVLDAKGNCIFANQASNKLTGGSPESIFADDYDHQSSTAQSARSGPQNGAVVAGGWQGIRKFTNKQTGEEVITSVMTSPVYDAGQYVGFIAIQRDITEEERVKEELEAYSTQLKESAEELMRANKQLEEDIIEKRRAEEEAELLSRQLRRSRTMEVVGQLAGGVAHDFNNVLGAILACLYMLRKASGDKPELATEVGHIRDLCKRGGELSRQLLGLGRRSIAGVGPVDIVEVLESLKVILGRTLPSSIKFEIKFASDICAVVGNRANLLTTFLNLALNARDAMPDGGELKIIAICGAGGDDERPVKITFEDTGCGIPASLHEKIFEPFFTTKELGVGTGLGLSTAYAGVSEAGGDITVESVPDVGTVMTVYLKAAQAPPVVEGVADSGFGKHPLTSGYILVVEDMQEIAQLMDRALKARGYRTVLARTGIDALAQLRDRRSETAAVLLDVVLPELSGLDVHRYIKRLAPEIPVLFITGREDLLDDLDHDCQVVSKPFDEADLLAALEKLLT
jgi:PAS domain S-box-containing protein